GEAKDSRTDNERRLGVAVSRQSEKPRLCRHPACFEANNDQMTLSRMPAHAARLAAFPPHLYNTWRRETLAPAHLLSEPMPTISSRQQCAAPLPSCCRILRDATL